MHTPALTTSFTWFKEGSSKIPEKNRLYLTKTKFKLSGTTYTSSNAWLKPSRKKYYCIIDRDVMLEVGRRLCERRDGKWNLKLIHAEWNLTANTNNNDIKQSQYVRGKGGLRSSTMLTFYLFLPIFLTIRKERKQTSQECALKGMSEKTFIELIPEKERENYKRFIVLPEIRRRSNWQTSLCNFAHRKGSTRRWSDKRT